ncbi:MAG TPA: hypothetical protein VM680_18650 [Verrucomicrobiae bacterium]|nr:hypothetical protein [Verrucomicrobiae bacterium]
MRAKFGKIVIADTFNGILVESIQIGGARAVQVEEFPEADNPEVFDRGNRQKTVSITTNREHKDEETAEKFAVLHDEELPIKDDLTLEGSFKGWRLFLKGAGLTQCNSQVEGCRTFHTYSFVGGAAETSKTT